MSKTRSTMRHANGSQDEMARRLSQAVTRTLTESLLLTLGSSEAPDRPALTVERSPAPVAPARLAELQPGDAAVREATRAMYEQFLHAYRSIAQAQDTGSSIDDAGAAVAFFVAASFKALHGTDASRHTLAALERQLRGLVRLASRWDSISTAERQNYFEQMAIVGVLVAARAEQARKKNKADLRNVQGVAREYLRQLLGVDAEMIALGEAGLTLRKAVGEARRAA